MTERDPAYGADAAPDTIQQQIEELDYHGRVMGGRLAAALAVIAAAWSLFQLWIASPLPTSLGVFIVKAEQARAVHLGFALLLAYLMYPALRRWSQKPLGPFDVTLALAGLGSAWYIAIFFEDIRARHGILAEWPTDWLGTIPIEAIVGGAGILLLLEATRRAVGIPLVVVALIFLAYSVFGQEMPAIVSHKGVSVERLIGYQWLDQEAIFGIPIDVSTRFIFLFVMFGALLERAGAGRYFLDLSFALVGRHRGGPAKASILASGMTGMISGSSIANVVTTGTFTIPIMRQTGMPATKAGAIEVAASTNGQLMPPIMGAAAFVMAEFLGVDYFDVIVAAFIPAVISYIALFYLSHIEALKLGLTGMPKADLPHLRATFWAGAHFLIPVAVLVYLLMVERWTTETAIFYATMWLMLTILAGRLVPDALGQTRRILMLAAPILVAFVLRWGPDVANGLAWLAAWAVGASDAAPTVIPLVGMGPINAVVLALGLTVLVTALFAWLQYGEGKNVAVNAWSGIADIVGGLIAGGRGMVPIAIAVAAAGIIVGAVSMSGLGNAMTGIVERIAGGDIIILLAMTAIVCIILGMGLPTTANYLIVASLLATVVRDVGLAAGYEFPLIAIHLFVFYYGLLADSTPPVCLAAFAASAISKASPLKTGVQSFMYDIRTAVLPWVFLFNTQLLLIGVESVVQGVLVFVASLAAILGFAALTQWWMFVRLRIWEGVLLLAAIFCLFRPGYVMDRIHAPFVPVDIAAYAAGEIAPEPGERVRIEVRRETDYGPRYKLFTLTVPEAPAGSGGPFGLTLEPAPDKDGWSVADVAFMSPAEEVGFGLQHEDYVTSIAVEQPGQPSRYWIYLLGFALLAGAVGSQRLRLRGEGGGSAAPAEAG